MLNFASILCSPINRAPQVCTACGTSEPQTSTLTLPFTLAAQSQPSTHSLNNTLLLTYVNTQPNLALVAENGCYLRLGEGQTWSTLAPGLQGQGEDQAWVSLVAAADFGWKKMALPILQQYQVCAYLKWGCGQELRCACSCRAEVCGDLGEGG